MILPSSDDEEQRTYLRRNSNKNVILDALSPWVYKRLTVYVIQYEDIRTEL